MGGGPPGFPSGFTCPVVLWILPRQIPFRLQGYYLLWRLFPKSSAKKFESITQSATPKILLSPVWPLSRSLAATWEISVDFSSWSYLDVSVHPVPFLSLCIGLRIHTHCGMWVPPFGHLRVTGYVLLTAAFRSLSRPSSAPGAKASSLRSSSLDHQFSSAKLYLLK